MFIASAVTVVWQNTRFAVLWDVSYILENATRIAAGDAPYRDFPFPYAPLTFLTQAAIIRIFGRAYWHHIAYAALICGASSAITFALVRRFVDTISAVLLCAPLAVLGVYCVLPNPFYDPDTCFVILTLLFFHCPAPLAVVPFFVKQNIGIAFGAAALLMFAMQRRWRAVAGVVVGAAVAVAIVAIAFGIQNYLRWTMQYAAQRRLPPLSMLLDMYHDVRLWWSAAVVLLAVFVKWTRWLIAAPFLWIEWRFFLARSSNEVEVNLLRLWPLFIVVALVVAIASRRDGAVPLLVIATIQGTFLSQAVWGSTYGIWPLLIILIAIVFRYAKAPRAVAAIVCIVLLHQGAWYIAKNRRIAYAKWRTGEPQHSALPALRGLTLHGDWLPEFEELVRFADAHIPRDDGILFLPGEDLFYFATGRKPQFPVLMFDATVNPYSPDQIASLVAQRRIRWVIIKERLQINGTPYVDLAATLERLRGFRLYAALPNYAVYSFSNSATISATVARGAVYESKRTRTGSYTPP